jgi:hypothetical protein
MLSMSFRPAQMPFLQSPNRQKNKQNVPSQYNEHFTVNIDSMAGVGARRSKGGRKREE